MKFADARVGMAVRCVLTGRTGTISKLSPLSRRGGQVYVLWADGTRTGVWPSQIEPLARARGTH